MVLGWLPWGMDVVWSHVPPFELCPGGLWVHPSSVGRPQAAQEPCLAPVLIQPCWLWHPLPQQGLTGAQWHGGLCAVLASAGRCLALSLNWTVC